MMNHYFFILAYDSIFKPDLCSIHDLSGTAILDGNIQHAYISAANEIDAVDTFDKKYSVDGHLPHIQSIIQLY